MPKGWPFEGQGTHGYPKYGWWKEWYPEEEWGLEYIRDAMVNGSAGVAEALGEVGAEELSGEEGKDEAELADAATFGGEKAATGEAERKKNKGKNKNSGNKILNTTLETMNKTAG